MPTANGKSQANKESSCTIDHAEIEERTIPVKIMITAMTTRAFNGFR